MSEPLPGDGLRREYEAGRISADSYIAAGGDPDVVQDVEGRRSEQADSAEAAKKADADRFGRRLQLGCLGVAVLVVGGCVALNLAGGDETAEDNRWAAENICKQSVEQQLKAPDSAQFDDLSTTVTDAEGPTFGYTVIGSVRAENSFGGTATHTFICDATYNADADAANGRARLS